MIAIGVVVAACIACRRCAARGGNGDDIAALAVWAVPAGLVGARQYLFGGPTSLPWGLEIDAVHRPAGYTDVATFHPTFLYEVIWNLALAALLLVVERRWKPRPGQVFAGYVAGYAAGRFWVEALRIDPATKLWGVRVNLWVSAATLLAATAVIVLRARAQGPPQMNRGCRKP
jgi:prolipoprotein diacylglyceryltransferase